MPSLTITRRALIAGVPATAVSGLLAASIIPNIPARAEDTLPVPVTPVERLDRAAEEYKAAALALYPDLATWHISHSEHGACVFGCVPPKPVEFSGFGVYEIKMGPAYPIVALAAAEGGGFFWQHYWLNRDRFEGEAHFIAASDLVIKRKVKALA